MSGDQPSIVNGTVYSDASLTTKIFPLLIPSQDERWHRKFGLGITD